MNKLFLGLTVLLTATSSFATDLTPEILRQIDFDGITSKVRVELDQQLTLVYRVNRKIEKDLKNGDLIKTTTEDFIVRKIDLGTKGKIVNVSPNENHIGVSFEKGCEEIKCLYGFEYNDGHYELSGVPEIQGYTYVSANSGILPFTNAFRAIDKVNLVINKKEILKVNKTVEKLGGYDSEN